MSFRFTRLQLENWRNFREVDVAVQRRVFIVGPNASGKTNLIDAFRFLRDLATPQGGLAVAVGQRGGIHHLRSLHARQQSNVAVEVELEIDGEPWDYRLVLEGTKTKPLRVVAEQVGHRGRRLLDRPDKHDTADPALLGQTHLEQLSQNRAFRVLVDALAQVQSVHVVPQVAKTPALRGGDLLFREAPGSDFIEQLAKLPKKKRIGRLNRIVKLLRVAVPQFSKLDVERDPATGIPHLIARYAHWRPNGVWQNEQEFSDGTLRLIGLLNAILQGSAPLIIEEPELSLHEAVVQQLPLLISRAARVHDRQVIVSTHSEAMLAVEGTDPSEVLLLKPTAEDTRVAVLADEPDVVTEFDAEIPISEIVAMRTRPRKVEQLSLALPVSGEP